MISTLAKRGESLLLLCVLALVVSVSGCIDGGGDGNIMATGPGIIIEEFKTPLQQIESGEAINLHLEIRNVGGYNGMYETGAPAVAEIMQIDPMEWSVLPATIIDMGTVIAPDPDSQTQGGLKTADWQLIAPPLDSGQAQNFGITARVFYEYETKARKGVQFVTTEEMRRMVQSGETFVSDAVTQTGGPLSVSIETGQVVKATDWSNHRFQLQITIRNTGGGQIRGTNYPVAIRLEYPQWVTPVEGYCPSQTMWTTPVFNDVPVGLVPPAGTYINLWDGQSTDVTCQFEIVQPPSQKTKGNFEVILNYIYSIDASTQLTVKGIPQY